MKQRALTPAEEKNGTELHLPYWRQETKSL